MSCGMLFEKLLRYGTKQMKRTQYTKKKGG